MNCLITVTPPGVLGHILLGDQAKHNRKCWRTKYHAQEPRRQGGRKHRTYRKHQKTEVKVPMTLLTPYKDLSICEAQVPGNQELASHPLVTSGAVRCMFLKRHKEAWPFPAAGRKVLGHCWWVRGRAEGSSRSFVSKSLQRAPATAFQLSIATRKAEVRAWLLGETTHLLHFQN